MATKKNTPKLRSKRAGPPSGPGVRRGNRQVVKTAGQPATPACRDAAFELYCELGPQWAEISRRLIALGYDRCGNTTISGWAKREDWHARKLAQADAPGEAAKVPHKAKRPQSPPQGPPPPATDLGSYRTKKTNLEHVRTAIEQVVQSICDARATADLRAIGSLATALVKLIELEGKLSPATAAELASRAVELGLDPEQFVAELAEQWRIAKVG